MYDKLEVQYDLKENTTFIMTSACILSEFSCKNSTKPAIVQTPQYTNMVEIRELRLVLMTLKLWKEDTLSVWTEK